MLFYMAVFIYLLTGVAAGIVVTPMVLSLLREAELTRSNFRHEEIPIGAGFSFLGALLLAYFPLKIIYPLPGSMVLSFFLGIWGISFLGFIDDVLGTHFSRGFIGHFKNLFHGRLTTGGLKAVGGGLLALLLSSTWNEFWGWKGWLLWIMDGLLIALFANTLNLFDLRPGRAGKFYILIVILLFIIAYGRVELLLLTSLLGAVLAYMPHDLQARAMMGDTGSNILGMALGITSALVLPGSVKVVMLTLLVALQVFTEKYSLTKIIENNGFLRFLDMLGRRDVGKKHPEKN